MKYKAHFTGVLITEAERTCPPEEYLSLGLARSAKNLVDEEIFIIVYVISSQVIEP